MNYKYKIGQKVKIKSPVENLPMVSGPKAGNYCGTGIHMPDYEKQIAKVTSYKDGFYVIDVDDGRYIWSDGMFEDIQLFSCRSLL